VDQALSKEINQSLNTIIEDSKSLHISQAVQLYINCSFLSEACAFWEKFLLSHADPNHARNLRLSVREVFQATRTRCEDLLFEIIVQKVDVFMSLSASFNWMASNVQDNPNDYIQDLILFLETTFSCMTLLPDSVREAVYFTSCRHISNYIMNMLENTIKKYNIVAVYNLHVDLVSLEEFAGRCPIANLVEIFIVIRQFVDLMLNGNPAEILDKDIRSQKYPHLEKIDSLRLAKLLDKYKDVGFFDKLPPNLPKLKRRTIDPLIKKLKSSY